MGEGRICPIHPPGGTVRTNVRGQPYLFYIDIFARPLACYANYPFSPFFFITYTTRPHPRKRGWLRHPLFSPLSLCPPAKPACFDRRSKFDKPGWLYESTPRSNQNIYIYILNASAYFISIVNGMKYISYTYMYNEIRGGRRIAIFLLKIKVYI